MNIEKIEKEAKSFRRLQENTPAQEWTHTECDGYVFVRGVNSDFELDISGNGSMDSRRLVSQLMAKAKNSELPKHVLRLVERVRELEAALAAEHMRTCPEAIAASCVFGMVTNEFLTEGPGQ